MDASILIVLAIASAILFFLCQLNVGADAAPAGAHDHGDDHGHGSHDEGHGH